MHLLSISALAATATFSAVAAAAPENFIFGPFDVTRELWQHNASATNLRCRDRSVWAAAMNRLLDGHLKNFVGGDRIECRSTLQKRMKTSNTDLDFQYDEREAAPYLSWDNDDVIEKTGSKGRKYYHLPLDGKYRTFATDKLLGEGDNGAVYLGKDIVTRELMAVKVMRNAPRSELNVELANLKHVGELLGRARRGSVDVIAKKFAPGVTLAKLYFWNAKWWNQNNFALLREVLRRVAKYAFYPLLQKNFIHMDLHFGNVVVTEVDDDQDVPSKSANFVRAIDYGDGKIWSGSRDITADVLKALAISVTRLKHGTATKKLGPIKPNCCQKADDGFNIVRDMYQQVHELPTNGRYTLHKITPAEEKKFKRLMANDEL